MLAPALAATASTFAGSPSECSARLGALARQAADSAPPVFLPVSPQFQPAKLKGPKWITPVTSVVEVGNTEVWVDGRSVGPADGDWAAAVSAQLSSVMDRRQLLHPGDKEDPPVGIWLDVRVPVRAAVQFLQKLSARYDLVIFAMSAATVEVPKDVADRLAMVRAETSPGPKARLVSEAIRDALKGCHRKDGKPNDTASMAGAIESARACSCVGTDIILLEGIVAPQDLPNVHGRKVRLSPGAKRTVTLSSSAGIGDLISRLPQSGPVTIRWRGRTP